ncbi:IS1294, transposase, truncation [Escherichia coli]|uniref:IS1294, transposase, truncation n=1 Tax=Escherichia coli TaxID=562 RepID=A0A376M2M5_ECOLX|nr:IS1294, transposase, truncation [Escherichia coli]
MEKPGAESRRKILACVHAEENGRREEYGALPGSLSEEATDSGLRLAHYNGGASLSFRYLDHKTGETATETLTQRELVAGLKQHIPEKFFKMVRYFGFLANRVCGEKLSQVYRALGMDKPEAVAKVCYAQM